MSELDPLDRAPDAGHTLRQYASAVWKRRGIVVLLAALGTLAGWWQGVRTADVFAVSTRIDIAKQRPFGLSSSGGTGIVSFGEGYYESSVYYPTRYALLSSRTYAERLLASKRAADGKSVYPMWDWLTWPAYGLAQPPKPDPLDNLGEPIADGRAFEGLVAIPASEFRRRFAFRAYGPAASRDPKARFEGPGDLDDFLSNKVIVHPEKGTTLVGIDLEGEDRLVLAPLLNLLIEVFWREQRSEGQLRLERERKFWTDHREDVLYDPAGPDASAQAPRLPGPLPRAELALDAWKQENLSSANRLELLRSSRANQLIEGERKIRELDEKVTLALPDLDHLLPDRAALVARVRAEREAAKAPAPQVEDAVDEAVLAALVRVQADAEALDLATAERRFLPMTFVSSDREVAALGARLAAPGLEGATGTQAKLRGERAVAVRDVLLRTVRELRRDLGLRLALRRQRELDDQDLERQWALSAQLSRLQGTLDARRKELERTETELARVDGQIAVEADMKPLKVIEPATDPAKPVRPNRVLLTLLGTGVGLLLGLSFALLVDWMDDTIGDPDDVARHVGVPVLGTIVTLSAAEAGAGADRIAAEQPRSPVAEAFRAVRTAVEFVGRAGDGTGGRILLISSCAPRDGKTTVASNLASVLAQDGKRTLLVDADLRRPRVHQVLGLDGRRGLSNVIVGRATLEETVQATRQDNLWALCAGAIPPNPAELLGRPAAAALFERLRKEFDRIVIDSPPVGVVTDAAVLAPLADLVLMVVAAGKTKKRSAEHGAAVLRAVGAAPAGVVMNQVARGTRWLYGGYYDREASAYYAAGAGGGDRDDDDGGAAPRT